MSTEGDAGASVNLSDIQGLPRGAGLGPGRFLFRGQLFWQELLPEHVATNQLEFRIGMGDDKRNYARIPSDHYTAVPDLMEDGDPRLIAAAVCLPEGRQDEAEVAAVVRAAASWGDRPKLRRLLASCFVQRRACAGAICEAAAKGHEEVVQELLRAGASPNADDGAARKTALHFACEQGHESIAKLLLEGRADMQAVDAKGRTPCELAREQDLGMMAKRLEKLAAGA
eukprot:CAMPEP_0197914226 /NCGR_PEP_ID=MMETSP1439-20131203/78161_1 /TAXON_ID=66791 /ORGANISM="Gonyaulax spinifera, Strain CCMP409" /LENGTH=226 /DNA_ID=CAMNT_0043536129 /DNA_START=65 /DNA_END=745 /DNA_ORIENTATION=+